MLVFSQLFPPLAFPLTMGSLFFFASQQKRFDWRPRLDHFPWGGLGPQSPVLSGTQFEFAFFMATTPIPGRWPFWPPFSLVTLWVFLAVFFSLVWQISPPENPPTTTGFPPFFGVGQHVLVSFSLEFWFKDVTPPPLFQFPWSSFDPFFFFSPPPCGGFCGPDRVVVG